MTSSWIRHHSLLIFVKFFQLLHIGIKVSDLPYMACEHLAALSDQHHGRRSRHAQRFPDLSFFIRKYGKRNPVTGLVSIRFLFVIKDRYSNNLDILG